MVQAGRWFILALLLIVWFGAVFLTSPAISDERDAPDLRPWPDIAPLRWLLDASALNGALPTENPTQIKALFLRGGATLMAVLALLCWGLSVRQTPARPPAGAGPRRRRDEQVGKAEKDALLGEAPAAAAPGRRFFGRPMHWQQNRWLIGPLVGLLIWALWALLRAAWSHAPRESTLYVESMLLTALLAVVVGLSLDRRLTRVAVAAWLGFVALLCALGLSYHYFRAPLRPLILFTGDAKELAGLLLPGLVLAAVLAAGRIAGLLIPGEADERAAGRPRSSRSPRALAGAIALLASAALAGWTISLTGRGGWQSALLAGVAGLGTAAILITRSRWRAGWSAVTLAALVGAGVLLARMPADRPAVRTAADLGRLSPHDRPLIERDRWRFARELFEQRPLTGHGGLGYQLLAERQARRQARLDPAWSDRVVGPAGSFWLEQFTDLGLIGAALIVGIVAMLLAAAGRAVRRCPWRRHRYLLAGLTGGLAAMLVHLCFASSVYRPAFAAALAGWVGLTAAAIRWADRTGAPAEYRLGFYRGGLTFLLGAALLMSALGYIVIADWAAARAYSLAVRQDIPQAQRLHGEILQLAQADPTRPSVWPGGPSRREQLRRQILAKASERLVLTVSALNRLDRAAQWSIDYPQRLAALSRQAQLRVTQVERQIIEQSLRRQAEPSLPPVAVTTSGNWTTVLSEAVDTWSRIERIQPDSSLDVPGQQARAYLLMAMGRQLSYSPAAARGEPAAGLAGEANPVMLGAMLDALVRARRLLDAQLQANPTQLNNALLRDAIGDPHALAGLLGSSLATANWLIDRGDLRVDPAKRLTLLRDGLRDSGLLLTNGPPQTHNASGYPPLWPEALLRVYRDGGGGPTLQQMEAVARRVEDGEFDDWAISPAADVRHAPETLRLLAELSLAGEALVQPASGTGDRPVRPSDNEAATWGGRGQWNARRDGRPGEPDAASAVVDRLRRRDWVGQADEYLGRAERLYNQPAQQRRFAQQRVIVALQRAKLAWRLGRSAEPALARALAALPDVDPAHRRTAAESVAAVAAFVAMQAGRPAVAVEWLSTTRFGSTLPLVEFTARLVEAWSPPSSVQAPALPGREGPASQPDDAPLWPRQNRPLPLPPLLGR